VPSSPLTLHPKTSNIHYAIASNTPATLKRPSQPRRLLLLNIYWRSSQGREHSHSSPHRPPRADLVLPSTSSCEYNNTLTRQRSTACARPDHLVGCVPVCPLLSVCALPSASLAYSFRSPCTFQQHASPLHPITHQQLPPRSLVRLRQHTRSQTCCACVLSKRARCTLAYRVVRVMLIPSTAALTPSPVESSLF
jgi:hypothetical protein